MLSNLLHWASFSIHSLCTKKLMHITVPSKLETDALIDKLQRWWSYNSYHLNSFLKVKIRMRLPVINWAEVHLQLQYHKQSRKDPFFIFQLQPQFQPRRSNHPRSTYWLWLQSRVSKRNTGKKREHISMRMQGSIHNGAFEANTNNEHSKPKNILHVHRCSYGPNWFFHSKLVCKSHQRGSLQKGFEKWEPKTWAREMPDGHTSSRWKVGWVLIVSETAAAATAVVEFAIASNSSPYPWNSKPE